MKKKIINLDNKESGDISLSEEVFGLAVRKDIIFRVINWQLAKRRSGNHKTKTISDISGTTAKPYNQKGTGRARQGSLRSAQFRGGATIFGPVVRSHAFKLPKKVRVLGLKIALSSKFAENKLVVLKEAKANRPKSAELEKQLSAIGVLQSVLIIDGADLDENFVKSAANLPRVCVLPAQGANVYDIIKYDNLVLTENAVKLLEERLA